MSELVKNLRDYADARDKDLGHGSGLTDTMREAADEIVALCEALDAGGDYFRAALAGHNPETQRIRYERALDKVRR